VFELEVDVFTRGNGEEVGNRKEKHKVSGQNHFTEGERFPIFSRDLNFNSKLSKTSYLISKTDTYMKPQN